MSNSKRARVQEDESQQVVSSPVHSNLSPNEQEDMYYPDFLLQSHSDEEPCSSVMPDALDSEMDQTDHVSQQSSQFGYPPSESTLKTSYVDMAATINSSVSDEKESFSGSSDASDIENIDSSADSDADRATENIDISSESEADEIVNQSLVSKIDEDNTGPMEPNNKDKDDNDFYIEDHHSETCDTSSEKPSSCVSACASSDVSDLEGISDLVDSHSNVSSGSLSTDIPSNSEPEEEDFADENETSMKLHNYTNLSREEGILRVLDVYLKNKCTKRCLQDILSMICSFLPDDHQMPESVHLLFKFVERLSPQSQEIKHFYCSNCLVYFGLENCLECTACHSTELCGIFYEFSITDVVKHWFEHRDMANLMHLVHPYESPAPNTITDIRDGSAYRNLNAHRAQYDLNLVLYTDGVKLKKSSVKEVWLLMVMPVEVPVQLRDSFITIVGVWSSKNQPNMNTFLKPFALKLKNIFLNNGVQWVEPRTQRECSSQILAPLFIADAPARAKIQNITNFNGKYGCNICEVKTVKAAPIPGKRSVRVYSQTDDARLREGRRMVNQGVTAALQGSKVKGVKGPSIMSVLGYIDLAVLLTPEIMHSVLLGVVRQLVYIWFEKQGPWSCKNSEAAINTFLNSIRVPNFFQRKPRDLTALKFWKASEFYNWLLYFSLPTLKPFLGEVYFQHYMLLVRSVFNLIQSCITEHDIQETEQLLHLFVIDVELLYGDREMSYNVHQLLHLGLCVKRWGPLHLSSAFPFEDLNGIVAKTTHGTKNIGQEIVNNIKLAQGIQILKSKVKDQSVNPNLVGSSVKVLGQKVELHLTPEENQLLVDKGLHDIKLGHLRARISKIVFTSTLYKQLRTADYHVSYLDSSCRTEYGEVRFFIELPQDIVYLFLEKYKLDHVNVLYHAQTRKSIKHVLPFRKSGELVVLNICEELCLRKVIVVGNYICARPNHFYQVM